MKNRILIIKNITREGPGILENVLQAHGVGSTVVDLSKGESLPDIVDYDALVVLGGPDSANDTSEKMQQELPYIKQAITAGKPYLGICLGLQTLVKVQGGSVVPSPTKEVGFRDPDGNHFMIDLVDLTEAGKQDPLFKGLDTSFKVFHLHGETVALTDDMTLLGTGKFCKNQIVRIGDNAYGIQCHFELTPEMFETWITQDPDLLELDTDALRKDFAAIQDNYTHVGTKLFENFVRIIGYTT